MEERIKIDKITVKICGLKTEADVKTCMLPGVDILGFVTEYPVQVPWNLSRSEVKKLLPLVRPPFKTCLVTGGTPQKIIELAESLRPSMIQLHFKETLEDTLIIVQALKPLGIQIIKTMPAAEPECIRQFGTTSIESIVKALCETEIYGILIDSRTPSNAAEAGIKADTAFYTQIQALSTKPVILAGGINADNIKEMTAQTKTRHIDVMTGVEQAPGVKDKNKLLDMLSRLN